MRTTSAGFAIGSAKPARGERETRRPSRAGAARCRRGRRALPGRGASGGCAGLHPRAVRSLPPHGAGTPRAVRPALRMNWISPACARGSFSIWSSTSIERADVDLWRVLHGARDILAWWRSHSRTDRRRCVRRASERERLLRTESAGPEVDKDQQVDAHQPRAELQLEALALRAPRELHRCRRPRCAR